ncbi:hypothetical protein VTH82DRAFT_1699 [Thermothelomyces myriococcoides]
MPTSNPSLSRLDLDADQVGEDGAAYAHRKSGESSSNSLRNQVLRVDAASMPTGAKVGLWLMGTTPEKMEKAARQQQKKRARLREEKRAAKMMMGDRNEGWERTGETA